MSLGIRKILYPTDFSESARQALTHALFLAEKFGAELHLLNALILHEDDPNDPDKHFVEPHEILERLFEISGSKLQSLIDADHSEILAVHEVTRRGYSAPEVILDYALEIDADLIAMGTHGRRGAARFFLGSVAESVVRHANCPVLTLKAHEKPPPIEAVEKILVPVDFSDAARQAVLHAREFATTYGARLQLLYVVEMTAYPYFYVPTRSEVWENRREQAMKALGELAEELLGRETPFETFVAEGRAGQEVARFAKTHESDLIVIASHGLGAIERLLLGSTTAEVVRSVDCPVMTVRSHGKVLLESALDETAGGHRAETSKIPPGDGAAVTS
ncbi:MAG: universal stress protein [Acidobacteriota bacterium]|nr:universal stress protein [Acidobacteriota bacterium]